MDGADYECQFCENTGLIRAWLKERPTGEYVFKCTCVYGNQSAYKIPQWSEKFKSKYISLPSIKAKYGENWQVKFREWYNNQC
jgi:hypothetical protein